MRQYLDDQQARLYELIWRRFLASQMKPALYATMTVDILAARDYLFRATGATLIFPGYLAVYTEGGMTRRRSRPGRCPRSSRARWSTCSSSCPSSTLPSRRRATPSRR